MDIHRTTVTPIFYANRETQSQKSYSVACILDFTSKGHGFAPHSQSTSALPSNQQAMHLFLRGMSNMQKQE